MNIFQRAYKYFSSNATGQKDGSQDGSPSTSAHESSPFIGIDSALQVSTVWACVSLIVETISSLPVGVYRTGKDGQRESMRGEMLYRVLHDSPNRRQTTQEFWEQMLLNFVLRGNMYARIERAANGDVISMWPLSADQVEVIAVEDGSLLYIYSHGNESIVYTEDQILHIKGMGNGLIGMSPLDYMRSSVGLAISAQDHTTATFKTGARRPGILMTDVVLNPEQRAAVKRELGGIVAGGTKELHILEAQFKFEPLGMAPADIQLLETRAFSVQDLARWFGVPSILINDTAQSTALGSSAAQIIDGFHRLKLRPQLSRIEQAIRKQVLTPKQRAQGVIAEFNLDALLRASLKDRMEIYSKAVQNGIKTRNECRKLENDLPVEGGDMLTAQVNLVPLGMLGKTQSMGSVPPETVEQ